MQGFSLSSIRFAPVYRPLASLLLVTDWVHLGQQRKSAKGAHGKLDGACSRNWRNSLLNFCYSDPAYENFGQR